MAIAFVSIKHRVAFIHVPRTGGTSLLAALRSLGIDLPLEPHLRARDVVGRIGRAQWEGLRSIAVVRDPATWLKSTWRYIRQQPLHPLFIQATVFDSWTFARLASFLSPPGWRQIDFITAADGSPLVQHVLRFERLAEEWAALAPQLGLPPQLRHTNASQAELGDQAMDDLASLDAIARIFAEDSIRLGYEMPSSARAAVDVAWARLREIATPGWHARPDRLRAVGEAVFPLHEFDSALYVFQRAGKLSPEPGDAERLARMPERLGEATPSFEDVIAAVDRAAAGVSTTTFSPLATRR